MTRRPTITLTALVVLGVYQMLASDHPSASSDLRSESTNSAGLVVEFGDGQHVVCCVAFHGEVISGLELLTRSGLDISTAGGAVCRIENDGCDYPAEPCFCHCDGSSPDCRYWSYWHWADGVWTYSGLGAAEYGLHNGDIDGWQWPGGPLSVQVTFDQIADVRRISPGVPTVSATCQAIDVRIPYQGDENGDGTVLAQVRKVGVAWPPDHTPLDRYESCYSMRLDELAPADYQVRLAVSDPDGVNGSATWLLTTTVGTVADFYFAPLEPWIHQTVTFTDTSRSAEPVTRLWDFGDGTWGSDADRVDHTYALPGEYIVTLTVESACRADVHQAMVQVQAHQTYIPQIHRQCSPPQPQLEALP